MTTFRHRVYRDKISARRSADKSSEPFFPLYASPQNVLRHCRKVRLRVFAQSQNCHELSISIWHSHATIRENLDSMSASLSVRPLAADILAECGYKSPRQPTQNAAGAAASVRSTVTGPVSAPPPQTSSVRAFELPDLKSKTAEETTFRAYFLAMAVINNHKMMVSSLAEKFNLNVESKQVQEKINRAVKILASASLFLIGLESGGISNDKSTMELLFASLRVVEKMASGKTVKELVGLFGNCHANQLNITLCRLVAQTLELNAKCESDIECFVCSEFSFRKEISCYACRQEVAALREQVVCFL